MKNSDRIRLAIRTFGLSHQPNCPNYPNLNPYGTECFCGMFRAVRAITNPKVYGKQWPDESSPELDSDRSVE
jgi:hypothetical protein